MVCRLQGRVHAGQQALLLSADHHGLSLSVPAGLRGTRLHEGSHWRYRCSNVSSGSSAYRRRYAPTMARPSPRPMRSLDSADWPSTGCAWAYCIERIKPGCPQQNGRHERMHLTLKKEATKPASFNLTAAAGALRRTSARFTITNDLTKPLICASPASSIHRRPGPTQRPEEPDYPFHDRAVQSNTVRQNLHRQTQD
jgi:hypothetical protein